MSKVNTRSGTSRGKCEKHTERDKFVFSARKTLVTHVTTQQIKHLTKTTQLINLEYTFIHFYRLCLHFDSVTLKLIDIQLEFRIMRRISHRLASTFLCFVTRW